MNGKSSKQAILNWCDRKGLVNYLIQENLTVDVDGSVNLRSKGLSSFPIKFDRVRGHFDCSENYILKSLEGSPNIVQGIFDCSRTPITTLEGITPIVGTIDCTKCKDLKSLHNIHKMVKEMHTIKCEAKSHLLGLCLIKGITLVVHPEVGEIMTKYLSDMLMCQEVLIDAGFAAYAKL